MKRKTHKRIRGRGLGRYSDSDARRMSDTSLNYNLRDLHNALDAAATIPHADPLKIASYEDNYMTLHDERMRRLGHRS